MLQQLSQNQSALTKIIIYRLCSARHFVEDAFRILANKIKVFQTEINLSVKKIEKLTFA